MDNGKVEKGVLKNSHLCKYEETIDTHIYIASQNFGKIYVKQLMILNFSEVKLELWGGRKIDYFKLIGTGYKACSSIVS